MKEHSVSTSTISSDQIGLVSEFIETAYDHGRYALELSAKSAAVDSAIFDEISIRASWWKSTCVAFDEWSDEAEATYVDLIDSITRRHTALLEERYGVASLSEAQRALIYARAFGPRAFRVVQHEDEYARLAEFALALNSAR